MANAKPNEHCTNGCSPSSSSRWLECTGSANFCKGVPNKTNEVTDMGSYFHELAAYKVARAMRLRATKPTSLLDTEEAEEFTDEYASIVMKIVNRLRSRDKNVKVLIEERVSIDDYIKGTFGTCDLAIISKGHLRVIDAKFGFKEVSPIRNSQLQIYSLGLLAKYKEEYGITKVTLGIYQPRISRTLQTYETTAKQILAWGEKKVKVVGAEILNGKGKFVIGSFCDYCPLFCQCRKHYEVFKKMENLATKEINKMSEEELIQVLENADAVEAFISKVKEYALSQMMEGKEYPGFKLCEGRSISKFTDEAKVVEACRKAGFDDMYKTTLISVAEMKKLMGKDVFGKTLGTLVERPKGKLVIAKQTDKRPAVDMSTAKQDFNDNKGEF